MQMYGLFALAKTQVPIASDGILDYAGADGLEYACAAADYNNPDTIYSVKVQPGCFLAPSLFYLALAASPTSLSPRASPPADVMVPMALNSAPPYSPSPAPPV